VNRHQKNLSSCPKLLDHYMVIALGVLVLSQTPSDKKLVAVLSTCLGLCSWTVLEYGFHRFVLHGMQPFARLHGLHHERPMALICTPTAVSAALITGLVFLPLWYFGNLWLACAITLGVVTGYWAYSLMHHATHHWPSKSAWLKERKRLHAIHHHSVEACCFGVTTAFWDRVFGTLKPNKPR
jgi:cyclopropane-fatty-acyl-phospholipid synthase